MNSKSKLLKYAHRVLLSFGTAYDVAHLFGYDYSNVKRWFRDPESIPVKIAFDIIDYAGAELVVFRNF